MKVLFVAPWVPNPRRPRSLGLLELLAQEHDVCVLAAAWSSNEVSEAEQLRVDELRVVRQSKLGGLIRAGIGLLARRSLQQSYVGSAKMRRHLRAAIEEYRPDVVFFNVLRSAQLMSVVKDTPMVVDLDDVRSDYYAAVASSGQRAHSRVVARSEAARMRRAEDHVLGHAAVTLFSSPHDAPTTENGDKTRLVRSPHRMISSHRPFAYDSEFPIVFIGRLSYRANVEAVSWFAESVMPLLLDQVPAARLYLIGENPAPEVLRLASLSIKVIGGVAEVAPYYAGAEVSIVPVEMATGVQMKLIESCALGIATVSSAVSARQAGVDHEQELLVATSPAEWADAIVRLHEDPELRRRLGSTGRSWAQSAYSRDNIATALSSALRHAARDGGQATHDLRTDPGFRAI